LRTPLLGRVPCRGLRAKIRTAEIILVKDSPLGLKGDIVTVRPGYARNFLIPHQMAVYAIEEHRKFYGLPSKREQELGIVGNQDNARALEIKKFMNHYSFRLRKVKLEFERPKAQGDELAQSVNKDHVLVKLWNQDFIGLAADNLVMEPIRQPGTFKVEVLLNRGWALPELGLFGELAQLTLRRNPTITLIVRAQKILSDEERARKVKDREERRQAYLAEKAQPAEKEEGQKVVAKTKDKAGAKGAKVKGKGKKK